MVNYIFAVYLCVVVLIDPDVTLLWHCVTAGSGQV